MLCFCSQLDCAVKVGEGTYGEAFRDEQHCFKIVPMDGDELVNGDVQKVGQLFCQPCV